MLFIVIFNIIFLFLFVLILFIFIIFYYYIWKVVKKFVYFFIDVGLVLLLIYLILVEFDKKCFNKDNYKEKNLWYI